MNQPTINLSDEIQMDECSIHEAQRFIDTLIVDANPADLNSGACEQHVTLASTHINLDSDLEEFDDEEVHAARIYPTRAQQTYSYTYNPEAVRRVFERVITAGITFTVHTVEYIAWSVLWLDRACGVLLATLRRSAKVKLTAVPTGFTYSVPVQKVVSLPVQVVAGGNNINTFRVPCTTKEQKTRFVDSPDMVKTALITSTVRSENSILHVWRYAFVLVWRNLTK